MKLNLDALLRKQNSDDDSQWLPVSDLMSGLMVLFLFIAVSFVLNTKKSCRTLSRYANSNLSSIKSRI